MNDKEQEEQKEYPLDAAEGIFNGCIIGSICWIIIIGAIILISRLF